MSSIAHIRSTSEYPDVNKPPLSGMTLGENLADLRRHADDEVIGCVYLYPSASDDWDVTVQSWV